MEKIGLLLAQNGYTLLSGNADGADQAFARGANLENPTKVTLFLPWGNFNPEAVHEKNEIVVFADLKKQNPELYRKAQRYTRDLHPAPLALSHGARLCLSRNSMQILGPTLDNPIDFVICWTPGKTELTKGGTSQALRIAKQHGVPWINLARTSFSENALSSPEKLISSIQKKLQAEKDSLF